MRMTVHIEACQTFSHKCHIMRRDGKRDIRSEIKNQEFL